MKIVLGVEVDSELAMRIIALMLLLLLTMA